MKKLLLLFAVIGCSLFADEFGYQASWTANTEPDLSHYNLYLWTGADSVAFFADSTVADQEYFVKSVTSTATTFMAVADGKTYIQAGLTAVDYSGNEGLIKASNVIKAVDGESPTMPSVLIINK